MQHDPHPKISTPPLQREVIARLFAILQMSYKKFITADDDELALSNLWAFQLAKTSSRAIEGAMRTMIDQHPKFAPTVGEFKLLAKSFEAKNHSDAEICDTCHGGMNTQFHANECGNGRYQG